MTEKACMRHDHGNFHEVVAGLVVKSGCDNDVGLISNTNNPAVHTIFGERGVAQFWGCWEKDWNECWAVEKVYKSKWVRYGWRWKKLCFGDYTRYGPGRYGGIINADQSFAGHYSGNTAGNMYGWKEQRPANRCTETLPWEIGCIKPGDCDW